MLVRWGLAHLHVIGILNSVPIVSCQSLCRADLHQNSLVQSQAQNCTPQRRHQNIIAIRLQKLHFIQHIRTTSSIGLPSQKANTLISFPLTTFSKSTDNFSISGRQGRMLSIIPGLCLLLHLNNFFTYSARLLDPACGTA